MGDVAEQRDYVLLTLEARNRGFKSTLAFRRWCQRHGVPLRVDGKKKWVRPADVTAAVEGLPITNDAPTRAATRLSRIEIAAKEFVEIEETYGLLEMNRWDDAFDALRKALEASNG